ncbi:MAG: SRPBCC family protein [Flavobacteriaceae bacterium]|nr:SRPBCC family protein [Flavobacteriaceae bacterium]
MAQKELSIQRHSGIYTLEVTQDLPIDLSTAWNFFSKPDNLAKITPDFMGFKITSKPENHTYNGQIITYKIGLVPGITSSWVTEIKAVEEQAYFIDEQRFGPYKMWHHEHHFEALPNGHVRMRDKVSYKLPFGVLGHMVHALWIKKQLRKIFSFRYRKLEELF